MHTLMVPVFTRRSTCSRLLMHILRVHFIVHSSSYNGMVYIVYFEHIGMVWLDGVSGISILRTLNIYVQEENTTRQATLNALSSLIMSLMRRTLITLFKIVGDTFNGCSLTLSVMESWSTNFELKLY